MSWPSVSSSSFSWCKFSTHLLATHYLHISTLINKLSTFKCQLKSFLSSSLLLSHSHHVLAPQIRFTIFALMLRMYYVRMYVWVIIKLLLLLLLTTRTDNSDNNKILLWKFTQSKQTTGHRLRPYTDVENTWSFALPHDWSFSLY